MLVSGPILFHHSPIFPKWKPQNAEPQSFSVTYRGGSIDASLLYALPDHTGPITSADMQTDSPYNLYQNAGLPPTPISNPGLASIDAALNPNSTDYYYYALGTDGKHHFSTTLAEHNAFVNSSSYGG